MKRWLAGGASVAVHAAVAIALAALRTPEPPPRRPPLERVEIEVREVEAPPPAPVPDAEQPAETAAPPSIEAVREPRRTAVATAPAAGPAQGPAPGMLAFGARAVGTEPPSGDSPGPDRVTLPTARELARDVVAGDPPSNRPPNLVGSRGVRAGDEARGHGLAADGNGGYRLNRETFAARVDRDGTVRFSDKPNVQLDGPGLVGGGSMFGIAGKFDITDAVMRANGEDPYRYEKQKFLDETRELRMAMAEVDRRDRLQDALHDLPKLLDRVWRHTTWPAVERRRALFDLWDECAEDADDDATAKAAASVRATILAFIRKRLPPDSADAYDDAELARLNEGRQSKQVFDPYGGEID